MKKLFVYLIIVFCLLCFSSAYAHDESYFYGTWVQFSDTDSGGASLCTFRLTPDHKAFYTAQNFRANELGIGRSFVGSWSVHNDTITIITGNNTKIEGYILENGFLAEKVFGGYTLYGKAPEYSENDATYGPASLDMLNTTGVVVPAGRYTIGEDIPAGNYRFEMENAQAYVYIYKNEEATSALYTFGLNGAMPLYGRQPLEEGNILVIQGRAVRISYAKSLFE